MTPTRWQAPREQGAVLCVPSWKQLPDLISRNRQLLQSSNLAIGGQSLQEIRQLAAQEILKASAMKGEGAAVSPLAPHPSFLIATGHQPELFHPGVLAKNFACAALAKQSGAASVNLNVDSDITKSTALSLPVVDDSVKLQAVHFSSGQPPLPSEEWQCDDEALFSSVIDQTNEITSRWPWKPLLPSFWKHAIAAAAITKNIPARWTIARHTLEQSWGVNNQEVALSRICSTEFFAILLGDFIARREELANIYNAELSAYRKEHGIRSKNHPASDLLVEGDLIELPFWAWFPGGHERGRLFAHRQATGVHLRVRFHASEKEIPGTWPADLKTWKEQWPAFRATQWKIRPKALVTTMMMRLFFADLFIHGIGGAVYDELTDRIFERFYRTPLPQFAVVTATLRLPWNRQADDIAPEREIRSRLHELRWNPDRFLHPPLNPDADHYSRLKKQLIASDPTLLAPRERFTLFRSISEGLQPYVQPLRESTEAELQQSHQHQKQLKTFLSREFPWVFYPENDLLQLLGQLT
jgi:hypothetical protein